MSDNMRDIHTLKDLQYKKNFNPTPDEIFKNGMVNFQNV